MTTVEVDGSDAGCIERIYAEGRTTFMGVTLRVARGALVPRAETEILGRAALDRLVAARSSVHVVDMCCGSGNLACAIATLQPKARVWASDLSNACVEVARANVAHLGLGDRVSVHQGDLFAGLGGLGLEGGVDLIVCNPPYISTRRLSVDHKDLLAREPREAFDGGAYGLAIHLGVIAQSLPFLKPGGWLLFEVGVGQARQVERLFERSRSYERCEGCADAVGNVRVVFAQKRCSS